MGIKKRINVKNVSKVELVYISAILRACPKRRTLTRKIVGTAMRGFS